MNSIVMVDVDLQPIVPNHCRSNFTILVKKWSKIAKTGELLPIDSSVQIVGM